jgi:hypothetical protein
MKKRIGLLVTVVLFFIVFQGGVVYLQAEENNFNEKVLETLASPGWGGEELKLKVKGDVRSVKILTDIVEGKLGVTGQEPQEIYQRFSGNALVFLGYIGSEDTVNYLLAKSQDETFIKGFAIHLPIALVYTRDSRCITRTLEILLNAPNPILHKMALSSLQTVIPQINDEELTQQVSNELKRISEEEKYKGKYAFLGETIKKSAIILGEGPQLRESIKKIAYDNGWQKKLNAILEILGKTNEKFITDTLTSIAEEETDPAIVERKRRILQYLDYELVLKSLVNSTSPNKLSGIKDQLSRWELKRDKLMIPPLVKALSSKDARIREMVINSLGKIADKNDWEAVSALEKTSNEDIDKKIKKLAKKTKKQIEKK